MSVLLDTNILVRYCHTTHAQHQITVEAVTALRQRHQSLFIVAQNLYEFWAVATRPAADHGLALTTKEAHAASLDLRGLFLLKGENDQLLQTWDGLVVQYDVKGKSAHDARLVAAMVIHSIDSILTFNVRDFGRYRGITVLQPEELVKQSGH